MLRQCYPVTLIIIIITANIATTPLKGLSLIQQTPLHIAASEGHDFTVECLVKKGADIKIKDQTGVSVTLLLML